MVNSDPKRTPTFTLFGDDDFFFQIGNVCKGPAPDPGVPECVNPGFAWNHGDDQDEIGNTWFGMVGPGVDRHGIDSKTWTRSRRPAPDDQRAARPAGRLHRRRPRRDAGSRRSSRPEGARRTTPSRSSARPTSRSTRRSASSRTTRWSPRPLRSSTSDALKYESIETAIANLTLTRNVLAGEIRQALNDASSGNGRIDDDQARAWIKRAQNLLDQAHALAVANPAS